MGDKGFSRDSSLLCHRDIPSAIVDSTTWELSPHTTEANHPLRPRHFPVRDLFTGQAWKARRRRVARQARIDPLASFPLKEEHSSMTVLRAIHR
jgi:hypothetical protein